MPDDIEFNEPVGDVPSITGYELLRRDGVELRSPAEVRPDQLRGCLWEIIYALAGRRTYLHSTDHLSDAQLYAWLHDIYLPRETRDLPVDDGWSCDVDVLGNGTEADNQVWLKYYADEELHRKWRRDYPEDVVPAREPAPFDRDRWLPGPPVQPTLADFDDFEDFFDVEGAASAPADELHDPLELEGVDREIHIEQPSFEGIETEVEEFLSESPASGEGMPQEPAVGIETENWTNPHEELARSGVVLPPADELTDEVLTAKLWEMFHELACRGFYLLHTDHLSDRELYAKLWRENLREPAILPGRTTSGGWFHDFVGSGSDVDTQLWLRYYADDLERQAHANEFPDEPLPAHEECPFDRDRRLPRGPF